MKINSSLAYFCLKIKKYISVVLLVLAVIFISFNHSSAALSVGNFAFTADSYAWNADINSIITSTFGSNYRLADWNDLTQYYQEGGDMNLLTNFLDSSRKWVSYNGNEFYSSNRRYFINVSHHNTPSGFLVHENIDSNLIDLGSWWNTRPILAFTSNPVPEPTTILLFSSGLIGLLYLRKKEKI